MSHTSYTNAAIELVLRIRDFPLEKLREEMDEKRRKMIALGWPDGASLEKQLNEYIGSIQALRYQTFDKETQHSNKGASDGR